MTFFVPLLANADDWVKVLVPIVMFSVYILNRLLGGETGAKKPQKPPKVDRPIPPVAPERQRVDDEVGEFLRRAAQQRGAKENRPAATQAPPPPKPVRPRLAEPVGFGRADLKTAEVAGADAQRRTRGLSNVEPTIAERKLDVARPSEVDQADEMMQSHLQKVFDHKVGQLGPGTPSTPAARTVASAAPAEIASLPAGEFVALLRDPQSIREAIIVSEILRRPQERW
ncbi:MAG: hypothetical protein HYX69_16035 [Planctomycetia bacterium]|nr:hypothetical protein [Planctomycetia bacterium]